ncbi:Uncharacterised protein [Kluyvera cryocrescens]|uniref:Uncharacterized protein n=1 Tax=Kluyvera cryocrescens TaxID=580 RepID=A0A485ADR1_KLUCR|nr:Uncharacterised protein [Kluyvera cryocrescens]
MALRTVCIKKSGARLRFKDNERITLRGFNLAHVVRQLYRLGRQLVWGKVVNVYAAQTALFSLNKNGGFSLINQPFCQRVMRQFVQASEWQVFAQSLYRYAGG